MIRARHNPALALGLLAGLSACGPVPVGRAEQSCLRDAELAQRPRGEIGVGVGGRDGKLRPASSLKLEISSDYIMGRDPSDVYQHCVMRRSGQLPRRPLYDQPGWRG